MTINTSVINYSSKGTELQGYFARPASPDSSLAAVIVVHEWWGHNDYVRSRADQLAEAGYAAFAVDLYGAGKSAETPPEAEALMNDLFSNPDFVVDRFDAAMEWLKSRDDIDTDSIAAMGYCMGGAIVLNMARAGKPLKAVCSYHGLLETETPMQANSFLGELAVFTGEDDPMVGAEIVDNFKSEMSNAGANLQLVSYPGVTHGFTNPAATARGKKFGFPIKYSQHADEDSWQKTIKLFSRIL